MICKRENNTIQNEACQVFLDSQIAKNRPGIGPGRAIYHISNRTREITPYLGFIVLISPQSQGR
jgi:hypothetical protein